MRPPTLNSHVSTSVLHKFTMFCKIYAVLILIPRALAHSSTLSLRNTQPSPPESLLLNTPLNLTSSLRSGLLSPRSTQQRSLYFSNFRPSFLIAALSVMEMRSSLPLSVLGDGFLVVACAVVLVSPAFAFGFSASCFLNFSAIALARSIFVAALLDFSRFSGLVSSAPVSITASTTSTSSLSGSISLRRASYASFT